MGCLAIRKEKYGNPRGGNAKDDFIFTPVIVTESVINKSLACTCRSLQKELTVAGISLNLAGDGVKGVLLLLIELAMHSVEVGQGLNGIKI